MTVALRRQIQELGESVPIHSQEGRDQLWRNVATELNHRHREVASRSHRTTRMRAIWLMGVVTCALFLVVGLPLLNQSHTSIGNYLLRTQRLEAAARPDRLVVFNSASHSADSAAGYHNVASNSEFELWLHEDGMRLMLRHKSSGQTWSTSPDVRDARVPASQLGRLTSPFSIRYGDASGHVDSWANPFDHATRIESYHISSGMGIRFVFEGLKIAVRLDFQLGDGYLEVSIPYNGIESYGSYDVKAIELLPFFEVRGGEGAGKLVLADALSPELEPSLMFGVTREHVGYMAEVVEGNEYASIHVDPSGLIVESQRVYIAFLLDNEANRSPGAKGKPTVRYHPVVEDDSQFDGVAEFLQRHMRNTGAGGRTAELLTVTG